MTPVDPRRPPGAATVVEAHAATVGSMPVRRSLPRRARRTVGAWCFVDHFGPAPLSGGPGGGMQVGPHPHIGLQTVTWLLEGEVLHTDSLGSEQLIRPGQLNVMTAGIGVAHAEQTPDGATGALHGVQLWVAQPDDARTGGADFEHHAQLPVIELGPSRATVLVGALGGARSPAYAATELLGLDLAAGTGRTGIELRRDFEHIVIPLDGPVALDGEPVDVGRAVIIDAGRDEATVDAQAPTRVLLLGGTPFPEPVLMWWNFVARTQAEVDEARAAWEAGSPRFGAVASPLARIGAPPTPWG